MFIGEKQIDLTHVYASFDALDLQTREELKIVRRSWRDARLKAWEISGARVQLLATSLIGDMGAVPKDFDVSKLLTMRAPGGYGDGKNFKFPTLGQLVSRGVEEGRGRLLAFSNADIGADPSLYAKILKLYAQDPKSRECNDHGLDEALEYLRHCFANSPWKDIDQEWEAMCKAGAEALFEYEGGAPGVLAIVWPEVQRAGFVATPVLRRFVYKTAQRSTRAELPLVITVTRLDLVGVQESMLKEAAGGGEVAHLTASWANVSRHGGNDFFVFPRDAVPQEVLDWGHPVGFVPWGFWLQDWLQSRVGEARYRFRRIVSSPKDRWTFHLSRSIDKKRPQTRLFEFPPQWQLYAVGNWFAATRGTAGTMFRLDERRPWCTEATVTRSLSYCTSVPKASWCQGIVPHLCGSPIRPGSPAWFKFFDLCTQRDLANVTQLQPACSVCRFLRFTDLDTQYDTPQQRAVAARRIPHCFDAFMEECGEGIPGNVNNCPQARVGWPGILREFYPVL